MEKTNVERLHEANALEGQELTDEQLEMINREFSPEEMKTLIKLKSKVMDHPSGSKSSAGGAF